MRQRAADGKSTIYIHTSGTSVLGGDPSGNFKTNDIYYDSEPAAINAVPDTAPHRNIDLAILTASRELGDKAKIALMIPPAIFGFNPKHKRLSMQIPTITRFALKHGFAGYIGKGLSVWSQVHVLDLARAYIVLLRFMGNTPSSVFTNNPYFFCEDGNEFSWTEAAEEVGKSLHAKGLIQDPMPKQFKRENWDDLFGEWTDLALGINSRSRAVRLRELGWKPQEKGIWESLNEDELPKILAEEKVGSIILVETEAKCIASGSIVDSVQSPIRKKSNDRKQSD